MRSRRPSHRPRVADVVALVRERQASLPPAQRQVAELLLADPELVLHANVGDLAQRAAVSPPTIVRFCRALGFAGLRDFKLQLAQSLANGTGYLHRAVTSGDRMDAVVHKVLYGAATALTNLERHIAPEVIEQAVARIAKAKRVDCYAVGSTSSFIAADAQARFFRLGLASNAYFDAHFQLISAASLSRGDVALAISYVGRMPYLIEAIEVAREQGATIIAITQPDTLLARRADIVLSVVVPADPSMRVGTEAYLAQMAYLEILMVGVGLRRGPSALLALKRVHKVLKERGIDSESHPALQWAWSKAERSPS
jgi:RpiR family carbohydrate utilization transcriptional regulator